MKTRHDVIGLPVICVKEGVVLGKIRELLVNCSEGKVQYIIIEDQEWYLGAKLLPLDKVLAIGPHAATTESKDNVLPISQVKQALDIVEQGMSIIGAKVYSQKGNYVGNIKEYSFSEENGSMIRCELIGENGSSIELDASQIITYGKGLLVIRDGVGEMTVNESQQASRDVYQRNEYAHDASPQNSNSSLFEQKQRRFLLGKRVTKKITAEDGELLASEGDIVTDEVIDRVKARGRLVELTMNIESV